MKIIASTTKMMGYSIDQTQNHHDSIDSGYTDEANVHRLALIVFIEID